MATVIESDGIRVEAESEQAAMAALRKAKRKAANESGLRMRNQQRARERAAMNGYRILSAYLDGGLGVRYIAWCEADSPCAPVVRVDGNGGWLVLWQSTNGADARTAFFTCPNIKGGLCDAGGWTIAVLKDDGWYAVGDEQGEAHWDKLPASFQPELS